MKLTLKDMFIQCLEKEVYFHWYMMDLNRLKKTPWAHAHALSLTMQYILFCVKYNSKYNKNKIIL